MKKKLFIISLIAIFFVCLFSFGSLNVNAAEKTPEEMVSEELENIYLPDKAIIDFPVPTISVYNSTITWEAEENQNYITINNGWAKVTRPTDEDKVVTLTVTIENSGYADSKEFTITVLKGTTLTNEYNITYVLNDGTQNANNPAKYKVGTDVALYEPTRGRVEFLGWYLNENFEGEALEALPKGLSGDITLYAKWAPLQIESIKVEQAPTKLSYKALEEFDPEGLKVVAVYNDGKTTKELALEELEFVLEENYEGLVLHGRHNQVTVKYGEFTTVIEGLTVSKLDYDLEGLFKDQSVVYNGYAQTYQLPNLPEGLTAVVQGSVKDVTATPVALKVLFTNNKPEDYNDPENITVNLSVTKAPLTVKVNPTAINAGANLPAFSITVEGLLGEDKQEDLGTPEYKPNVTDTTVAGTYTVEVSGLASNNYEISYVAGTLVIISGQYEIYVDPAQTSVTYDGTNKMFEAVVKDGNTVLSDITLNYEYNNKTFTGAIDQGTYYVTVSYHHEVYGDGTTIVEFKINKAKFDVNSVEFNDSTVEYDGTLHGIEIEGKLPFGVTVEYTEGLTDAGSKVIEAIFTGSDNYEPITETLKATLTVTPKNLTENMFESIPAQSETGEAVEPAISGKFGDAKLELGTDFTVTYENNIAQGTAKAVVTGIGNFQGEVELSFEIGESDLVKARKAREALEAKYTTNELPTEFVTTINSAKVQWFSTSTALGINNANGGITMIQVEEEQVVLVYALVIVNNAAEYASFEFVVPALEQGQEPEQPEQVEADYIDFSAQGYSNQQEISEVKLNNSTLVFDKQTNSNSPKYYDTGTAVRLYASGTLTISSANKIVKVVIEFGTGDNDNEITTNVGEYSDGVITISEGTQELILTVGGGTKGHRRIKTITVHYYSATGEQPDEPDQPTHEHTVCPTCGGCTATECDGTLEKCEGHPVEPEHEHVECPTCGGCTAEDCDGTLEKCPGHTQEPEQPSENGLLVTFEFGENGSAAHVDGNDLGTSKSYTEGTYTLELTNMSKVYGPAYDAKGNSAIKLGTSKLNGSFSFTVAENVTKVVIKVAGYKANAGKVSVNGTEYTIETLSDNGAYTEITIDTTTNKTITLATVGTVYRAMVDSIAYYGGGSTTPEEPEQPEQPTHEHVECPTCGGCTAEDCDGAEEDKCSCSEQEPEQPTYPESGEVTIEQAIAIGSAKEHNTYTEGEYVITGTVKEVKNTQYGNLVITDGTKEILVYGTYNASGQRYDAMSTRPVVGDTVVYTGVLGQYNGTAQMKNGVVEFEVKHQHSFTNGKCDCGYEDPSYVEPDLGDPTEGVTKTYTFADYTAGTQYAENEVHELDSYITVTTTKAHFTSELRLYSSSTNDAFAIIECNGLINGLAFNAGNKVDTLNVYGSADGVEWTLIEGVSITSTSYKDYAVAGTFEYKYIKLDVAGTNQVRIKSITVDFKSDN